MGDPYIFQTLCEIGWIGHNILEIVTVTYALKLTVQQKVRDTANLIVHLPPSR